jgi:hypothetical protein
MRRLVRSVVTAVVVALASGGLASCSGGKMRVHRDGEDDRYPWSSSSAESRQSSPRRDLSSYVLNGSTAYWGESGDVAVVLFVSDVAPTQPMQLVALRGHQAPSASLLGHVDPLDLGSLDASICSIDASTRYTNAKNCPSVDGGRCLELAIEFAGSPESAGCGADEVIAQTGTVRLWSDAQGARHASYASPARPGGFQIPETALEPLVLPTRNLAAAVSPVDAPTALRGLVSAWLPDGRLAVVGHAATPDATLSLAVLDVAHNAWTRPNGPDQRLSGPAAIGVVGGRLLVATADDLSAWDPKTQQWTVFPLGATMRAELRDHVALAVAPTAEGAPTLVHVATWFGSQRPEGAAVRAYAAASWPPELTALSTEDLKLDQVFGLTFGKQADRSWLVGRRQDQVSVVVSLGDAPATRREKTLDADLLDPTNPTHLVRFAPGGDAGQPSLLASAVQDGRGPLRLASSRAIDGNDPDILAPASRRAFGMAAADATEVAWDGRFASFGASSGVYLGVVETAGATPVALVTGLGVGARQRPLVAWKPPYLVVWGGCDASDHDCATPVGDGLIFQNLPE